MNDKEGKEVKKIREYLESEGIEFSNYNPVQRADLIICFSLGRKYEKKSLSSRRRGRKGKHLRQEVKSNMAECKYKKRCKKFDVKDNCCLNGEMNWLPYGVPPCFNDETTGKQ
jgi:hypothetical protein